MKLGSDRAFAYLFAVIFLAIALYPWATSTGDVRHWSLVIAVVLGIGGLFVPRIFHLPNRYWIKLGELIGRIMSPIVLGLIFVVVVSPIALVARLFGSDPLRMKRAIKDRDSYWIDRDPAEDAAITMTRQF